MYLSTRASPPSTHASPGPQNTGLPLGLVVPLDGAPQAFFKIYFRPVAELLTPQDWAAVAAAVPAGPDPLFGEDIEARYRKLRRHIALEAPRA